jgi:imidazoleglycerol-phosphate dehydratase
MTAARMGRASRKSKETDIDVEFNLDGHGVVSVDTGIAFLDHMLTAFAMHGLFDLTLKAKGDLHIDLHHTNEDIGLVLGQAIDQALGDRKGIQRMGFFYVPMDDSLVRVSLDFSGRGMLILADSRAPDRVPLPMNNSSNYQWADAKHLLESLARTARLTVNITILSGDDFHHTIEAAFKALGRAMEAATRLNPRVLGVPSSKGAL